MLSIKRFLPVKKRYVKKNSRASFIVGFQIFLLACAGLLILDNSLWAEGVAVVAYVLPVICVALQLISFIRHEREKKDENA